MASETQDNVVPFRPKAGTPAARPRGRTARAIQTIALGKPTAPVVAPPPHAFSLHRLVVDMTRDLGVDETLRLLRIECIELARRTKT